MFNLDIGNSRTCGVLCEGNDLTTSTILSLRDIGNPWRVYDGSFNMRLAFHRAEFGKNNMGISNVFQYRSFLRIGEEARNLISRERSMIGVSARLTHHSSPKRYLWDAKPFRGKWEFLVTDGEPFAQFDSVYVKRLSEQFKVDGSFKTDDDKEGDVIGEGSSFSRRSLMTMVMIEILQQAYMQINSYDYRNVETGRGEIDRSREINNIIITCPTAMSHKEQIELRRCAHDAYIAIRRSLTPDVLYTNYNPADWADKVHVVPSEADLTITKQAMFGQKVEWGFDEATCCQMVYMYSEIIDRYHGNCEKVIEAKGHVRPELKAEGYDVLVVNSDDALGIVGWALPDGCVTQVTGTKALSGDLGDNITIYYFEDSDAATAYMDKNADWQMALLGSATEASTSQASFFIQPLNDNLTEVKFTLYEGSVTSTLNQFSKSTRNKNSMVEDPTIYANWFNNLRSEIERRKALM